MCKNFIKSLKETTEILGKERMDKALEGMTASELLDLIMQNKPLFSKDNDLSEKRRAAANARWNAQRNANTICKTDMQDSNANVDTQQVMQNEYAKDNETLNANLDANNECKTECKVDVKEDTKEEYIEPTKVNTEQDLINVADSVVTKPAVQTTTVIPTASYSELQAQFNKLEAAAHEVMETNDPFTIKAFRTKVDNWYKSAGVGAVEFIGDVNFLTQQLMIKLMEIAEKEKNNE